MPPFRIFITKTFGKCVQKPFVAKSPVDRLGCMFMPAIPFLRAEYGLRNTPYNACAIRTTLLVSNQPLQNVTNGWE